MAGSLFDTLTPLFALTNAFGLNPCTIRRQDSKIIVCKLKILYCFAALILFVGLHIYATSIRTYGSDEENSITITVDKFHVYGIVVILICIIMCNCVNSRRIIWAIEKLHGVDLKLEAKGYNLRHKKNRLLIIATCTTSMVLIVLAEAQNCHLFINDLQLLKTMCFAICLMPLTVIWLEDFQFIVYVQLLRQRFQVINRIIGKLAVGKSKKSEVELVIEMRQLHLDLCLIGKSLNDYFSLQILLLIGLGFVEFTSNTYNAFNKISENFVGDDDDDDDMDMAQVPSTLVWVCLKLIEMLLLSAVCCATKNEVFKTGELLYGMENRYKSTLAPKINLFGKQIIHCNFRLTAFGFFDLDMTLFYGIVGSAATYLTILIQFEVALKQYSNSTNSSLP